MHNANFESFELKIISVYDGSSQREREKQSSAHDDINININMYMIKSTIKALHFFEKMTSIDTHIIYNVR